MPYRICKSFVVESGHILSKHLGKCRFPHGHSRRVEVTLESDALDENDMVCDFKRVKVMIEAFVQQFDHAMCLNTADPNFEFYRETYERVVGFDQMDPTSEVMAKRIYDEAASALMKSTAIASGLKLTRVRVHETETSWAEYCID